MRGPVLRELLAGLGNGEARIVDGEELLVDRKCREMLEREIAINGMNGAIDDPRLCSSDCWK